MARIVKEDEHGIYITVDGMRMRPNRKLKHHDVLHEFDWSCNGLQAGDRVRTAWRVGSSGSFATITTREGKQLRWLGYSQARYDYERLPAGPERAAAFDAYMASARST